MNFIFFPYKQTKFQQPYKLKNFLKKQTQKTQKIQLKKIINLVKYNVIISNAMWYTMLCMLEWMWKG